MPTELIRVPIGNGRYCDMTQEELDRFLHGVDVEASNDAAASMGEYLICERLMEGIEDAYGSL